MSATQDVLTIPADLARYIRATMTPEVSRYAADEAQNVFLALEREDADILFVMASRALASGATNLDSFIIGYAAGRASTITMPDTVG